MQTQITKLSEVRGHGARLYDPDGILREEVFRDLKGAPLSALLRLAEAAANPSAWPTFATRRKQAADVERCLCAALADVLTTWGYQHVQLEDEEIRDLCPPGEDPRGY